MPRYGPESIVENSEELYEEFFEDRGVQHIRHYTTAKWPPLTAAARSRFTTTTHRWTLGDKFWKLASIYYGDPTLWWVIAWYNEKPTEAHATMGDTILIPTPVGKVISYFNVGINY